MGVYQTTRPLAFDGKDKTALAFWVRLPALQKESAKSSPIQHTISDQCSSCARVLYWPRTETELHLRGKMREA